MASLVFAYIWEFRVKEQHVDAFEHAYGPNGQWVQLFKKGLGYIATELHRDRTDASRFITVDYWISKEARDNFKKQYVTEFKKLDEQFEQFTESEKLIGDFDCFTDREINPNASD